MNWNAVCALPNQKKNGKNAGIYSKLSMIEEEPWLQGESGCWKGVFWPFCETGRGIAT
jgi:hypothetical protein